jgi:SagB-type dehydrogenase family enzyme
VARSADHEAVRRYHERSTHHPDRFAPGPGHLDWASQPDPFRTWAGAPRVGLPLASAELTATWKDVHRPGRVVPRRIDRDSLGAFFELSLGITAWKAHGGSRWALRANPSSGNLHPTEGYALLPEVPGAPAGLYHYLSRDHVLERRLAPSTAGASTLARWLRTDGFLLGLASIHWREAWKYGERAFRYCQHDVGHALGAARYAAAVLGWSARLLAAPSDGEVAAILGLDRDADFADVARQDREHPDALVLVTRSEGSDSDARRIEEALEELLRVEGVWAGRANPLSPAHVEWPGVDAVAAATAKPRDGRGGSAPTSPSTSGTTAAAAKGSPVDLGEDGRTTAGQPATTLIRRRRSAVDMDGTTAATADVLFGILAGLLPRPGIPCGDVLPWRPRVHLLLFVHRVEGLAPGLYALPREAEAAAPLRASLRPGFVWVRPPGCPPGLPLSLLEEGDARSVARLASCGQTIASDSAFAVAFLAFLEDDLREGAFWYRRLFWECGILGQALYMEAEASGLRATGIGCYFDDLVHDLVGVGNPGLRDLYHLTVGGAVEDARLITLPAYGDDVHGRPRLEASRGSGRA